MSWLIAVCWSNVDKIIRARPCIHRDDAHQHTGVHGVLQLDDGKETNVGGGQLRADAQFRAAQEEQFRGNVLDIEHREQLRQRVVDFRPGTFQICDAPKKLVVPILLDLAQISGVSSMMPSTFTAPAVVFR